LIQKCNFKGFSTIVLHTMAIRANELKICETIIFSVSILVVYLQYL
jgi:hypothetical protein